MITPIKQIAAKTMVSNPIAVNPQKAYNDSLNCSKRGEKLNINCNEVRSLSRDGLILDYYA